MAGRPNPRSYLQGLAAGAFRLNERNILELLEGVPVEAMLDLGCDDGSWTMAVARACGAKRIAGIEIVPERAALARAAGVQAMVADLNRPLPIADGSYDLVHANQVIEHVADLDRFLSEVHRVLRPGGASLISTENASSWHNIGAAVLGWQQFSLTNVSPRASGLGNPFALHREGTDRGASWTHKTVFNYRGLLEIHELYGMRLTAVRGAGYHPLPVGLGRWDARHAHLLAVLARKPS
jgi:SAM-dependent methyltransferase